MKNLAIVLLGPVGLVAYSAYVVGPIFKRFSWQLVAPESLLVYFVALLLSYEPAGYVMAGWLAFKVASKWETWNNVVKVPDRLDGTGDLEYFRARRHWGDLLYSRFMLGTLLNLMGGGFAAFVIRRLLH